MKKRKPIAKPNNYDYLKELEEWQEHQYDPGYYVGEKLPPYVTSPGNPKLLGWAMVVISVVCFFVFAIVAIQLADIDNALPVTILLISFGTCLIQFAVGMRLIRKGIGTARYKRFVNKLLVISLLSILVLVCFITMNTMFLTKSAVIKIDNGEGLRIYQANDKNYIVIDNKLTLRCEFPDYLKIWSAKIEDIEATFSIGYKWNTLTPNKGVIQKLERIK